MAATDYAQVPLVMLEINKGLAADKFAWKIDDGDAPEYDAKTGQLKAKADYKVGCYILKFSTMFEIGACDANGVDIRRDDIKVGDYVDVVFNAQVNGNVDHTAGLYLNPVAIRRLGFGEAISSQVSASQAFAGKAAVVPPGATTMPQGVGMPPVGGMPQQGMPQQGMPQAGGMPMQSPQGMPQAGVPLQQGYAPVQQPMVSAGMPQGMPAASGQTASPYPQILTGGMPGVVR